MAEPAAEPTAEPAAPAAAKPAPKPAPAPATAKKPEWRKTALTVVVSVLLFAAIAFVAFALLARLCPDFVDKLLYTKEELEILNAVL